MRPVWPSVVHALVTCHLDYCDALPHDVSQYQQQRLHRVLNAAAHLICRLPNYCHQCLKTFTGYRSNIESSLRSFCLFSRFCRAYHPHNCRIWWEWNWKDITTSESKISNLSVPKTKRKTFGDRAFFKFGPVLWNSLPDNIRQLTNTQTFKKNLKHFYLDLRINERQSLR